MRTVIIGGVAAGMSAASKLKRLRPEMDIVVLEKGRDLSYGACGMPYYLSGLIPDEAKLIARTKRDFEDTGIDVRTEHEVIGIDTDNQRVHAMRDGDRVDIDYDRLVIATGASPIRLDVPGRDLNRIHTLSTLEDARGLRDALNDPNVRHVTIVGGGYIGIEIAENVHALGKDVTIIEAAERVLSTFSPFVSDAVQKTLAAHDVTLHTNERVTAYEEKESRVHVVTPTKRIVTDLVIEAVGIRPNTGFLNGAIETTEAGAIVVDSMMRTNVRGVYAAGDCVAYPHKLTGKPAFVPLGTHANKAGRVVAEHIAEVPTGFDGVIGSTMLKAFNLEVARVGLNLATAEAANMAVDETRVKARDKSGYYPDSKRVDLAIYTDPSDARLLGADMVGEAGVALRINTIATAIGAGLSADAFARYDLAYAPPFSPVYDPLQIACMQVKPSTRKGGKTQ